METSLIEVTAALLLMRRITHQISARYDAYLRPHTIEDGFAIQQAMLEQMEDTLGGWKCSLPNGDDFIVAPILGSTIFEQSPCPIQLDGGVCKIEPEIAFKFAHDLPSRKEAYTDEEITAALGSAHLALELIQNRYVPSEEVTYYEHLADCLFNQGVFVGPEITLSQAFSASEINFTLAQSTALLAVPSAVEIMPGKHPHLFPQRPLFWLVNFLSRRGIDIKAGQVVITGSYAGVLEVQPNVEFSLVYGDLGRIIATFQHPIKSHE
jgi:2-keto-4-pentenoate hydratase